MKRFALVAMLGMIAGVIVWSVPELRVEGQEQKGKILRAEEKIPNRYIVVFEEWAAGALGEGSNAEALASEFGAVYEGKVDRVFKHALNGFSVEMNEKQVVAMSRDPRIKYIEEDTPMSIDQTTQSNATWGLDRVDQRDLPLNGNYVYDGTGTGVFAYIVDTGIRASHNDFGGRVVTGYTAINDGRGTDDCNGHGTHVAGTTGGSTWGVAKGVTLVPVRVLDCRGSGTTSGVIAGVDYVTNQKNANPNRLMVANMSLGGGANSSLDTAVNNSVATGVTFVVAAGNSNANACNYSPARAASAITVGATTSTDARASYSNFGSCLDIFAPGSSITSAWYLSNTSTNTISGTSMASPHVAGVAALYLAANPASSPSQVTSAITTNATGNKVTSAGSGSPNLLLYSRFGGGAEPTPSPSPTVSPEPTPEPTPSSISLSVVMTKQQGVNRANLSWSGATASADVYRNGTILATVTATSYVDNLGRGSGSQTYRVCSAGTSTCSADVSVSY